MKLSSILAVSILLVGCSILPKPILIHDAFEGLNVPLNQLPPLTDSNQTILLNIMLDAKTGEIVGFKAKAETDMGACVNDMMYKAFVTKDGIAQDRRCKVIDKNGQFVDEIKVDSANKPLNPHTDEVQEEAPKVTT